MINRHRQTKPAPHTPLATQAGFSTVELLISLFIAAAFITTAFQLFFVVTKDSSETRRRAQAGSIVNQALRENASRVNDVCSPTPGTDTSPGPSDFPSSVLTVEYSCPYGPQARTTRITASLVYDESSSEVRSSLDVSR